MVIRKKPIKIPQTLVDLGRAVSVRGTSAEYKWPKKDNVRLCASVSGKTLYCLRPNMTTTYNRLEEICGDQLDTDEQGIELYEAWSGFEVDTGCLIKPPRGFLWYVELCHDVVYESDKWSGKLQKYIHSFATLPSIWVNRKQKPTLLVLSGGKIKTTKRGITG